MGSRMGSRRLNNSLQRPLSFPRLPSYHGRPQDPRLPGRRGLRARPRFSGGPCGRHRPGRLGRGPGTAGGADQVPGTLLQILVYKTVRRDTLFAGAVVPPFARMASPPPLPHDVASGEGASS